MRLSSVLLLVGLCLPSGVSAATDEELGQFVAEQVAKGVQGKDLGDAVERRAAEREGGQGAGQREDKDTGKAEDKDTGKSGDGGAGTAEEGGRGKGKGRGKDKDRDVRGESEQGDGSGNGDGRGKGKGKGKDKDKDKERGDAGADREGAERPDGDAGKGGGHRGMGEFVRACLQRGLRGAELADAIHAEQERRK